VKKPIVSLALAAAILLAGLFACQKYSSSTNSTTPGSIIPPDIMVTASVQGRVVDQDGIPVQGATITSGAATATTDVNGVFSFKNISLSSRFGYLKAAKSGYFTGSRSIATTGSESSFVIIQLVSRSETGNFPASSGGKIMVNPGDTVAFPANSLVNASTNAAYTGTVHVFATYLNPTNDNLTKYMPGDLRGITTDGKEVALKTYGMMNVELQDDAGNKLQVASGQQATITMALPSALQGTAPATIPLWYFNDSTGRWIQQGTGTLQGNSYIGNVSHFTWWNCDVFYIPFFFKGHIKDQAGNPVPYIHAILYNSVGLVVASSYSDSTGLISGFMPNGEACVLKLITDCNNILGGANVGPNLNEVELGNIIVTLPDMGLTVKGTVVDCFNNPVASGFVNVLIDGLNYRAPVTNGQFNLQLTRCYAGNAPAQITAGDFGASQQGATITKDNVQPGTLDVGQLSACGVTTNQFVTVTFNGNTYTQTSDNSLSYAFSSFYSFSNPYLMFSINGLSGTGTFTPDFFIMRQGSSRFGAANDNTLKVNVTGFGAVNQFITGTLSGNIYDSTTTNVYPMTGSFKLLRTN
jgi:hypothetical protein